jgi:hypothetical protein
MLILTMLASPLAIVVIVAAVVVAALREGRNQWR